VTSPSLRLGILGAARIAPQGVIKPAARLGDVEVVAVAARDPARARTFATKHAIGRVHESYDDLIADPEIDAVYNPLPNALHARWSLAAIAAGKHVLCEKPFTSNAAEAREVAVAAESSGLVVMEAFHYRYHPLAARMREIVTSGELGEVTRIDTSMCIPLPLFGDIRYNYALGGGATMDVGCYALHMNRYLAGATPEILAATPTRLRRDREVDRAMRVEVQYPTGVTGTVRCALFSRRLLDISVRVAGTQGRMRVFNPTSPQAYHRLVVKGASGRRREPRIRSDGTYTHQLRAFATAVRGEGPVLTDARDAVTNMAIIDAVYDAAGMRRRGA